MVEKRSPDRVVIDSGYYKRLGKLVKKYPYKYASVKSAVNLIISERLEKEKL